MEESWPHYIFRGFRRIFSCVWVFGKLICRLIFPAQCQICKEYMVIDYYDWPNKITASVENGNEIKGKMTLCMGCLTEKVHENAQVNISPTKSEHECEFCGKNDEQMEIKVPFVIARGDNSKTIKVFVDVPDDIDTQNLIIETKLCQSGCLLKITMNRILEEGFKVIYSTRGETLQIKKMIPDEYYNPSNKYIVGFANNKLVISYQI
jgi:hypothetical protein